MKSLQSQGLQSNCKCALRILLILGEGIQMVTCAWTASRSPTQRGRRAVARTPCIGCGTSTGEPRFPDHQFHPDGGLPAKSQGELHGCGRSRSVRGDRRFSAPGHRGVQMFVAEQRPRGQRQMERRAKPARRSSHLIYPKAAALELQQSRSAHKNQNPQNWHLMARFDWGLGAVCFGASPVAAVFGSAPGSATSPEHQIHFKPASPAAPSKQDISTLLGIGHCYFALTWTSRFTRPSTRPS